MRMAASDESPEVALRASSRLRLTKGFGPVLLLLVFVHPVTQILGFVVVEPWLSSEQFFAWKRVADAWLGVFHHLWVPITVLTGILFVSIAIEILLHLLSRQPEALVALDSGGLRFTRGEESAYVPFEDLAGCALIEGGNDLLAVAFGDGAACGVPWQERARMTADCPGVPVMVALSRDGAVAGWAPVAGGARGLQHIRELVDRMESQALPASRALRSCPPLLARHGFALSEWLGRSCRILVGGSAGQPYRTAIPTREELSNLARNPDTSLELRAVAVHALASASDARDSLAGLVDESSPPLVVAAAALAKPRARVSRELLERIMPFLSEEDQACVLAAGGRRDHA